MSNFQISKVSDFTRPLPGQITHTLLAKGAVLAVSHLEMHMHQLSLQGTASLSCSIPP